MSSNKKRRELNRAIEEHDRVKLSAQFAVGNHSMLNIAESILAKENAALKEQVVHLQFALADTEALELAAGETIAQQAEALRVKDEALLAYPVRGEYFLEHLDATWMWDKALAIQPSPDILLERDARLVERINRHLLDIGDNCSDDPLQHIANQIRNGEINV